MKSLHFGPAHLLLFKYYWEPGVSGEIYLGGNKEARWAPMFHLNLFGLDAMLHFEFWRHK